MIQLFAKLPSGRTVGVSVNEDDTIAALVNKLRETAPEIDRGSSIVFAGGVLDNALTITKSGLTNEATIHVVVPKRTSSSGKKKEEEKEFSHPNEGPAKNIDVFCKLPSGRTLAVNVQNTDSVQSVLDHIKKTAPEANVTHLAFAGRNLPTNKNLRQCGIEQEATVHGLSIKSAIPSPSPSTTTSSPSEKIDPKVEEELREMLKATFSGSDKVQIVFIFDTTGSMYCVLNEVRIKLEEACTRLIKDIPQIEIGIIAMGDYCDQDSSYVTKSFGFSSNASALCNFAKTVAPSGGGDADECYEWALRRAKEDFDWKSDYAKAVVMIGDCAPHPISYTTESVFWYDEALALASNNIRIYGVHAKATNSTKEFYEVIARVSGGLYLTFNNFSLITEMFLAVCYRESSGDKLEKFKEEMKKEGKMEGMQGEALNSMLSELSTEKKEAVKEDCERDNLYRRWKGSSSPCYALKHDRWVPYSASFLINSKPKSSTPPATTASVAPVAAPSPAPAAAPAAKTSPRRKSTLSKLTFGLF